MTTNNPNRITRPVWPHLAAAARRAELAAEFDELKAEGVVLVTPAEMGERRRAERLAELELSPAELIAEHTGRREYLEPDTR